MRLRLVLVQLVGYRCTKCRCTALNICLVILPAPCTFCRNALVIIALERVGSSRFCVHTCLHKMLAHPGVFMVVTRRCLCMGR